MKILIPVWGFEKAGGYRVLSNLANHWIDNGHQVTFVSYFKENKPYYPIKAKIIWINKNGEEVKAYSDENKKEKISFFAIKRFLKKNSTKFDVVLANYNLTAYNVWLGSSVANYYYIQAYEPELYPNTSYKKYILKLMAWITYFLPLKRIVNADIYRRYKNIKSNIVIPPGLDFSIYYPKKLEVDNKETLIVGCIGRTEEWKGSNDVGEAVRILHEKGYKIILKSAFNPVKYENHDLVLPDGDNNLADFYRSLDVLIAPGHIQLGAVHYPVIEAMACNVPVITTGYYPANDENSFITPIKRPERIAELLEIIINNYSIAVKKSEVAQSCIRDFDWKIVSQKFIDEFRRDLNDNKGKCTR